MHALNAPAPLGSLLGALLGSLLASVLMLPGTPAWTAAPPPSSPSPPSPPSPPSLSSVPPPSAAPAPRTQALIEAARKAYDSGDTQGALQMLRPAGYAASREAQFTLGHMLESLPRASQANYAEAANWYYRAALAGHPGAMNNLAALHHDGLGVPVTLSIARIWYERASRLGFAPAQYNLALMHGRGTGMPRNEAQMLTLLEQAATGHYAPAEAQLGLLWLEGLPGAKLRPDAARAADWFGRAAQQGHAEAQYRLGLMLLAGQGLPRDTAAALKWLRAAADQQHLLAAWETAQLLEADGLTDAQDAAAALGYYRASATAGHVPAMQKMLITHQQGGLGQPPSPALANFWKLRLQMAARTPAKTTTQRSAR